MQTAANAKVEFEYAQSLVEFEQMTDSGDHTVFTATGDIWSEREGYEPEIRPNGVVSGTNIFSPNASNDTLTYTGFTAYVESVLVTKTASTIAITRASTDTHVINSVTMDSSGTLTATKGVEGTSFSTTRGAAGGPPYIPVDEIELCQVKTSSQTAAVLLSTEIFQSVQGGTQERYDYPIWKTPKSLGDGNQADDPDKENAYLEFASALAASHTGDLPKRIWIQYHTPDFLEVEVADEFSEAAITVSTSSTQYYRTTVASKSESLGTASFTMLPSDGISDTLIKLENEKLIFRYYPNVNQTPYSLTQGWVGFATSNPASDNISTEVTIAADKKTVRFDS